METNFFDPLSVIQSILSALPFLTVKLLALILFAFLAVSSLIILRQVSLLDEYLKTEEGFLLKIIVWCFMAGALVLWILAFRG